MRLSIIIPYYNVEEWLLRRCLDSIFAQQVEAREYEVIVVDDGSTTPPTDIVESYHRGNLRLLLCQHKCLGGARNNGLEAACGEYILFMDADDYLYAGTLHQLLQEVNRSLPDILDFRFRVTHRIQPRKEREAEALFSRPMNGDEYMSRRPLIGSVWHYLFSKALCDRRHLRFEENAYIEDEQFTTMLYFHASRIVTTELVVYAYYRRPGSITTCQSEERQRVLLDSHFRALKGVYEMSVSNPSKGNLPLSVEGLKKKITSLAIDYLRRLLRMDDWRLRLDEVLPLWRSWGIYPLRAPGYGVKYALFCRLANRRAGLHLLRLIEKSERP